MGKTSKAVSKNLGGIIGGVFALAAIGIVGYVILRRDEIISGLDNRFNFSGGGSAIAGGGAETTSIDTTGAVDDISNNDADSSSPNTSNQNQSSTLSPHKSSQHNKQAQIQQYQNQQNQNQNQQVQSAGYQLAVQYAPAGSEQQAYNQYLVNKQGFDRAATFQSPAGEIPKVKRDSAGKAVVNTAVPKAISHLFSSGTRVVTSKAKRPNVYAGLSGGHTGFRQAGG